MSASATQGSHKKQANFCSDLRLVTLVIIHCKQKHMNCASVYLITSQNILLL